MSIEELKLALVKARIENEKAKEDVRVYRLFMESTMEGQKYKVCTDAFAIASEALIAADKALRDASLEEFQQHDQLEPIFPKTISPGIKIKFHHKIKYALEEVTAWAKVNALHLFKFDEAMFKKNPPDGAPFTKYDEPYVEVATDSKDFQLSEE